MRLCKDGATESNLDLAGDTQVLQVHAYVWLPVSCVSVEQRLRPPRAASCSGRTAHSLSGASDGRFFPEYSGISGNAGSSRRIAWPSLRTLSVSHFRADFGWPSCIYSLAELSLAASLLEDRRRAHCHFFCPWWPATFLSSFGLHHITQIPRRVAVLGRKVIERRYMTENFP